MSSWRDAPVVEDDTTASAVPSWMSAPVVQEEPTTPEVAPEATPEVAGEVTGEDRFANSPSMTAPTGPLQPMDGPNMGMYDGMTREQALALYNSYRDDPESGTGFLGELTYKGKVVPFPEAGLFGQGPGVSQYVAGAVRNSARNVLQTAGAGIDLARNKLFAEEGEKTEPGFVSRVASDMAEVDAGEGFLDKVAMEGQQLVLGGLFGAKGLDKIASKLPVLKDSKVVRGLAKFLGFEVGGGTTVDDDVSLLLLGNNALFKQPGEVFPLLKGAQYDEDDPEYEKVLKNRLNILTEGAMLAKPAEAAVKGAAWTLSATWAVTLAPLVNAFRKGSKEEALANDILNQLALVGSKDDAAALEAKKAIADLIRENQDTIIRIGEDFGPDIEVTLDTMSALEKAIRDQDTDLARQLTAKLRGMRSGTMNQRGGAPQLTEKLGEPNRVLENVTVRAEDALGGSDAIEGARRGLVESGQGEIDQARAIADDFDLRLGQAEQDLTTLIREDPTFGAKLDQLSTASGINIYSGRNQASEEIVANVRRAYETMDAQKNALYGQIQGGEVDPRGLLGILNNLRPGQLDAAAGALPANSQFGDMLNAARRQTVQETDAAGNAVARQETDEELLDRFTNWMDQNGLDFSTLYRDIRPSVSQTAENLFSSSSPEGQAAARVLRDFTSYIDGRAVDDLIASGDDEVAEAAMAAKEYYMREYAPFWRDGVLKDVADTYRNTVGRTSQSMRDQGLEVMPIDFQRTTRQSLEGALNDTNREYAGQVINLLSRPEGGQNAGLVTDYILGDIVGDIGVQLRGGANLSDLNVDQIVGRLNEYGAIVSRNFPEQAARVGQFIDNVRNARGNIDALRAQVDEAMQMAKQAEDSIYSGELGKFFNAQGVPNPNGYAVMEQIFNSQQSQDTIAALLRRADESGDPIIRAGMQAAYARHFRNKFLGTTEEMGGNRALNAGEVRKNEEGIKNALEYGDQIYSDRPEFMEGLRTLLDLSGLVTRSKGAKSVASDSATASRLAALQSANQIITFMFGVLNRVGARVRSASTTLINKVSPDEAGMRIMDALMADKDYFLSVVDRSLAKQTPMDEDIRNAIFSFLVRTGVYTADDEQDYLSAAMDAELNMREKVNEVESQMQDAFLPRN
jgi:hypothetical protein